MFYQEKGNASKTKRMFQICLSYSQARKGKKFTVEIIVMEIKQEKKTKKKFHLCAENVFVDASNILRLHITFTIK